MAFLKAHQALGAADIIRNPGLQTFERSLRGLMVVLRLQLGIHTASYHETLILKVDFSRIEELKERSFKKHTFISLPKQTSPMNSKQMAVVSGIWKIF